MARATMAWLKFALLVSGMAGIAVLAAALGFDWSHLSADRVREAVRAWGWWTPVTFFFLYGQPVVPLPITVVAMAAGVLFGVWWGAALMLATAVVRGCGQFLLARLCGREAIQSLLKGRLATWDDRLGRQGFKTVCWIRLVPNVPYDLQNLGLGCSRVSLGAFALGTMVGTLPIVALWVAVGRSVTAITDVWRVVGVLLAVAAAWMIQRRLRARPLHAPS